MAYPPREFIREFAREHPWLALGMVAFHLGCWVFVLWLLIADRL